MIDLVFRAGKRYFRNLTLMLCLAALCLASAGCGGSGSGSGSASSAASAESAAGGEESTSAESAQQDTSQAAAQESRTLKIGVLKIADSFPLYAAQAEGLFEEKGLNVEIVEFSSASDQSVAYEAGELDGMMTDMIVQSLINKASGEDGMKAVAMAFGGTPEEGRFLVISTPDAGIEEPADLTGKKIGISENTMMEYLVTSYLEDLGVDLAEVELVNIPKLTLRLDSVMEGSDIQAAILPDPLAIEAENRGCPTVIDDTQLGKNYSQSVITLRSKICEQEPEIRDAFLDAYNEAIDRIDAEPDSFEELFYEKANVADALHGIYTVPSYTSHCVPTEEEVAKIQDWMVGKGLLDEAFSYGDIVQPQE